MENSTLNSASEDRRSSDTPESNDLVTAFESLGLSELMLAALREAGYAQPTPAQAGLIPRALAGVDVMGQARTGTGKTASFVIPILELLHQHRRDGSLHAIILVPTRELAVQVREELV